MFFERGMPICVASPHFMQARMPLHKSIPLPPTLRTGEGGKFLYRSPGELAAQRAASSGARCTACAKRKSNREKKLENRDSTGMDWRGTSKRGEKKAVKSPCRQLFGEAACERFESPRRRTQVDFSRTFRWRKCI